MSMLDALGLTCPSSLENPYPYFARARAKYGPVVEYAAGSWIVNGYEAALSVLSDPSFATRNRRSQKEGPGDVLFLLEEVDHDWLRVSLIDAMRRQIERLRSFIDSTANHLVEEALRRRSVDIIDQLAAPLPVLVMCRLLGISENAAKQLREYSAEISRLLDPEIDPVLRLRGMKAGLKLFRFSQRIVLEAQADPREGLISDLLQLSSHNPRFTRQSLVLTVLMFLVAAHETTTNLIGNGIYLIVKNRDQFADLKADSSLVRSAIEEMLRYDSPAQLTQRFALRPTRVGEIEIPEGAHVSILIGAANRHFECCEFPDRFDIHRKHVRHLSFSRGTHSCLGASLGRYEALCVLRAFCSQVSDVQMIGAATHRKHFAMRGFAALPVRLV